jgi:hypothetical protein
MYKTIEELRDLYSSPRMRWAGPCSTNGEKRNVGGKETTRKTKMKMGE